LESEREQECQGWQGCELSRTRFLLEGVQTLQFPWKLWQCLLKLDVHISLPLTNSIPGNLFRKNNLGAPKDIHRDAGNLALLVLVKDWKAPRCKTMDKLILVYSHNELHTAMKVSYILLHTHG
jgi:hypothetical protein